MIGATKLTIDYSADGAQGVQLNARLYDVFPDGYARDGRPRPVAAARARRAVTFELHGNGWRFEPATDADRARPGR